MNTKRNLTFGYNAITKYLQLENVPQVNTFEFRDRIVNKGYNLEYNLYPFIYNNLDFIKEYINSDMTDDNLREKLQELGYHNLTVESHMKNLSEKELTLNSEKLVEMFVTKQNAVDNMIKQLIEQFDQDELDYISHSLLMNKFEKYGSKN